jgi:hypothetical protein
MPLAVSLAKLKTGRLYTSKSGQVMGEMETRYRNTCYCTAVLSQEGGKITGRYCGNRWCLVCARIRTARAIHRYQPVVEGWGDKWFVTLTLRNVTGADLADTIDDMIRDAQSIKLALKRTDRVTLIALRKLECTYNHHTDTYHPHFHFVVNGQGAARGLVRRWLAMHPTNAEPQAQHMIEATGAQLKELFKYFTKLVTRQKTKGNAVTDTRQPMPVAALDVIFRAIAGRRTYQPVGFVVAADAPDEHADTIEPVQATTARTAETIQWEWSQRATDWVDARTGECLTGYEPGARFERFVSRIGEGVTAAEVDIVTDDVLRRNPARRAQPHHLRTEDATDGELQQCGPGGERWRGPRTTSNAGWRARGLAQSGDVAQLEGCDGHETGGNAMASFDRVESGQAGACRSDRTRGGKGGSPDGHRDDQISFLDGQGRGTTVRDRDPRERHRVAGESKGWERDERQVGIASGGHDGTGG